MGKPHLALVDPDDDAAIDSFLEALGAGRSSRAAEEEDDTHHYYGAWYGGKKSQGGHPGDGYSGSHQSAAGIAHGAPVGGMPAHAGPVAERVAAFEAGILKKNPGTEHGMAWDKDGNPIYDKPQTGTRTEIRWTTGTHQWRGGALTHLHPRDPTEGHFPTSLSNTDIITALRTGLHSIRAFNHDGAMELIIHDGHQGSINEIDRALTAGKAKVIARMADVRGARNPTEYALAASAFYKDYWQMTKDVIGQFAGLELITTGPMT